MILLRGAHSISELPKPSPWSEGGAAAGRNGIAVETCVSLVSAIDQQGQESA
jgi:hypothetical protein